MGRPMLLSRLAFTPSLLGSLWCTAGSGGGFFRASAAIFWAAAIFLRSASFSPSCPITFCSHADCFSIEPFPASEAGAGFLFFCVFVGVVVCVWFFVLCPRHALGLCWV